MCVGVCVFLFFGFVRVGVFIFFVFMGVVILLRLEFFFFVSSVGMDLQDDIVHNTKTCHGIMNNVLCSPSMMIASFAGLAPVVS